MGKLKCFEIILADNKSVFHPGERVLGQVIVELKGDMKMRSLRIFMRGVAKVHWTESRSTGSRLGSYTEHFNAEVEYFFKRQVLFGGGRCLPSSRQKHHCLSCVHSSSTSQQASNIGRLCRIWTGWVEDETGTDVCKTNLTAWLGTDWELWLVCDKLVWLLQYDCMNPVDLTRKKTQLMQKINVLYDLLINIWYFLIS